MDILKIESLSETCEIYVDDNPMFYESVIAFDNLENITMTTIPNDNYILVSFDFLDSKYKIDDNRQIDLINLVEVMKKTYTIQNMMNQHLNIVVDLVV